MKIDVKQLEINVNFHALQPDFSNLELHYIIAENENTFRFADWNELPKVNEEKFYSFLKEKRNFYSCGKRCFKRKLCCNAGTCLPLHL